MRPHCSASPCGTLTSNCTMHMKQSENFPPCRYCDDSAVRWTLVAMSATCYAVEIKRCFEVHVHVYPSGIALRIARCITSMVTCDHVLCTSIMLTKTYCASFSQTSACTNMLVLPGYTRMYKELLKLHHIVRTRLECTTPPCNPHGSINIQTYIHAGEAVHIQTWENILHTVYWSTCIHTYMYIRLLHDLTAFSAFFDQHYLRLVTISSARACI